MKTKQALHITFHNPNTPEETVRMLVCIAAEVAKSSVNAELLSIKNEAVQESSI